MRHIPRCFRRSSRRMQVSLFAMIALAACSDGGHDGPNNVGGSSPTDVTTPPATVPTTTPPGTSAPVTETPLPAETPEPVTPTPEPEQPAPEPGPETSAPLVGDVVLAAMAKTLELDPGNPSWIICDDAPGVPIELVIRDGTLQAGTVSVDMLAPVSLSVGLVPTTVADLARGDAMAISYVTAINEPEQPESAVQINARQINQIEQIRFIDKDRIRTCVPMTTVVFPAAVFQRPFGERVYEMYAIPAQHGEQLLDCTLQDTYDSSKIIEQRYRARIDEFAVTADAIDACAIPAQLTFSLKPVASFNTFLVDADRSTWFRSDNKGPYTSESGLAPAGSLSKLEKTWPGWSGSVTCVPAIELQPSCDSACDDDSIPTLRSNRACD